MNNPFSLNFDMTNEPYIRADGLMVIKMTVAGEVIEREVTGQREDGIWITREIKTTDNG